ncbi:hypothetical protein ACP4OV_028364 [Aristida adscensionis]
MELNNEQNQVVESDNKDMLSMLPDDILLSILGRVDVTTAARASILSKRWKHLPWLLRELTMDVKDFLPSPHPNPIEAEHMNKAMASLTKAARSFLVTPRGESTISRLQLKLYLINNYSDAIGPLVSEAIDTGALKDLELGIVDEEPDDCTDEKMLRQARSVDGFFSAYPSVLHCLTRVALHNVCFAKWDMHHLLFDCCKELRYLFLSNCDAGMLSTWKINAPNSRLCMLDIDFCLLENLEILCLPKLEQLRRKTWYCLSAPLSLGGVPSLKELELESPARAENRGFKLSEVLGDTTAINNLTLNFNGLKVTSYCLMYSY